MLIKIQRQTLVKSTLVLALLLKSFDLLALPALAKQSDNVNLQVDDLAALSSSSPVAARPAAGQCSPLSFQGGSAASAKVASTNPSDSVLAQAEGPGVSGGGSCPADFTSIPCGTGSELFCEVGAPAENQGGGILAPLASAAGGGFPVAALAPLALAPLAFIGGGGGGGGGGDTPPSTPPDTPPVPEPSMIPAAALVFGFILWNRRKRTGV